MLFAKEEVNTGRQLCIDFAKVFAIVFMVLSHVIEYTDIDETVGIAYRIMFIGSHQFAAPIFMLAMGLGLVYTRHGDPVSVMRRGLRIFTAGIILNVVRCVPSLAGYLATENPEMLELALEDLVIVDIFQLAGLSLMLMGLFQKIRVPYWGILLFSLAASLVGSQMQMISSGNNLLDAFLALFVGVENSVSASYFPLLNWFIFVAAGYGLGKLLRRCAAPAKLFLIVTPITAAIYLSYRLYAAPLGLGMFNTESALYFYQISTLGAFISMCAAIATIGVGYFLMKVFSESIQNEVSRIAGDLMRIYVVSWIIITWIISLLLEELLGIEFNVTLTIIAGVITLLASILLARVKPFSNLKL